MGRRKRDERETALSVAEAERRSEAERRHKREIQRRMHPQTYEDFEILYNELEAWKQQETAHINEMGLAEPERLKALEQLLHKQQKLLQTIDRLHLQANDLNKNLRIRKTLELMSAPKKW